MPLSCLALTQTVFPRFWDHGVVCNSSSCVCISSSICPVAKNLPANAGVQEMGVWSLGRGDSSGVINGNLPQYFLPGTFHGHKELDMTKHTQTHTHTSFCRLDSTQMPPFLPNAACWSCWAHPGSSPSSSTSPSPQTLAAPFLIMSF